MLFEKFLSRKLIYLLLIISIIFITMIVYIPVKASKIIDIDKSSEYSKKQIEYLADKNIVQGDNEGFFNPKGPVTRAQMVAFIIRANGIDTSFAYEVPQFADVPKTHWGYKYIEAAFKNGIVKGGEDNLFSPDERCTREQMITMFVRSLKLSDEYLKNRTSFSHINMLNDFFKISDWAKQNVEFSLASGLMKGYNNSFDPSGFASREQAAVVIYRFITNRINVENGIPNIELHRALADFSKAPFEGSFKANVKIISKNVSSGKVISDKSTDIAGVSKKGEAFANSSNDTIAENSVNSTNKYDIFSINGRGYKKDDNGKWILSRVDELKTLSGFSVYGKNWDKKLLDNTINKKLLDYYSELSVEKAGEVTINGEKATKFILSPLPYELKDLLDEYLPETKLLKNEGIYFDGIDGEIYVDKNNDIIGETFKYMDTVISMGQSTTPEATINISFKKNEDSSKNIRPVDFKEQAVPDPSMNDRTVYIANQNLKKTILGILGKDKVTEADMLQFTELDLSFMYIDNLTGLEYAKNLEKLILDYNNINLTGTVAELTKLKYLDIKNNMVDDLSFVDKLRNLSYLDVSGNYISDLTPLSRLAGLRELTILGMKREVDWDGLLGLNDLTSLHISYLPTKKLSILGKLTKLTDLSITDSQLTDVSSISSLTNLIKLDLSQNRIKNTDSLSKFKMLSDLNLQYNQLTDLKGLENLTELKRLALSFNQISDTSPLMKLNNVEYIGLDFNSLRDLGNLRSLPNLKILSVQQNPLLSNQ